MPRCIETATFYAHFDVVKEGEPPLAPLVVRVCDSITCAMFGAEKLLAELQCVAGRGRPAVPMCASCARPASACAIRRRWSRSGTISCTRPNAGRGAGRDRADDTIPISRPITSTTTPMWPAADTVCSASSGRARSSVDAVLAALDAGDLRGLGGAGFPTGAQVALGARRARAAADGGQRRRGRARHVQGPPLPELRSAPLPRRDADRRPRGRGRAKSTSTCATSIRSRARS